MRARKNISRFIVVILISALPFALSAQDLTRQISIHVKNMPMGEVLRLISKEGKVYFSYNPQQIPVDQKVTLKFRNQPLNLILDELKAKTGVDYFPLENQVVLKYKNSAPVENEGKPAAMQHFTLSGFLKDSKTDEALIGANVYIRNPLTGTTTNAYGFYSITLPAGQYTMIFSFIGYKVLTKEVNLDRNKQLTMVLEETKLEIREVVVSASGKTSDLGNNQLSDIRFSRRLLQQLPGFAGDVDVIRSLQVIPGITSYGDGSSFFYVRGGSSDQNLMLIDEAPIYNPTHLFGFFSALSPDAINDIQVFKGDFPASYGGRLSSVIDIHARNGNMNRFGFSVNIGPYASTLTLEGPIIKNRCSFLVSGRISTLNWINNINTGLNHFNFSFYDLNAKLNYRINENNRLFLTFYYGRDAYSRPQNTSIETYGISWDNMAGTFRWNHVFSSRLFSNTTVYASRYNYYLYLSEKKHDYWKSSISNLSLKSDLTWYLSPKNTMKGGIEFTPHYSDPGNVTLGDNPGAHPAPEIAKYQSLEYDLYLSNDQKIGKKITLRYGIRLPAWQNLGSTTVYKFNSNYQVIDTIHVSKNSTYSSFFSPEPRIGLQYDINSISCVKASYTRTTQFIQVLSNSVSPFTSLEVWVPSGPNINPQKADQYSAGYFLKAFGARINFSAEAFYKQYHNHIDYKDHANLLYNPLIEGELRFGKAWSYGIELMVRKTEGKVNGWVGYSWSRAFIQTDGVNNNEAYPAFYDRPHSLCINLAYNPGQHWEISCNWTYSTGSAVTTPVGFYISNGTSVPIYGKKNNDRLPDYHRLDLSVAWIISNPENRYRHSLLLTLYNAYGNMNPYVVSFNRFCDGNGDYVIPANKDGNYNLIPTTLSVAGIIPSINYQFKF